MRAKGVDSSPISGEQDLRDKKAVEAADRRRFDFVKALVSQVESRKTLARERGREDKIDDILTNRWLGLPIFAVVMFLVFNISQASFGPLPITL